MPTGSFVAVVTYHRSMIQATVIRVERISIDYKRVKLMLRGVVGYIVGLPLEGKSFGLWML